jgi:hypothetical protein
MLNFLYNKYKDIHTITNNSDIPLGYTISKVVCENLIEVQTSNLAPGATVTLNFKVDGDYSIFPYDADENGTPFIIKYYEYLLASFLTSAEALLCNCKSCSDCEECDSCQDYLDAFMKATSYNVVQGSIYSDYIKKVSIATQCEYTHAIGCEILTERVMGSTNLQTTLKKVLEVFYASFYYKDKLAATDLEELNYITAKYKCILKLKIKFEDLVQIFEESPYVYFWQLLNEESDISDVQLSIAASGQYYLDTKSKLPYVNFDSTVGGVVTLYFGLAGPICFAIQAIPNSVYNILNSANTNLNIYFDSYYEPNLNALVFVSKPSLTILPEMEFKFLKVSSEQILYPSAFTDPYNPIYS